jgi:hypothetical protein
VPGVGDCVVKPLSFRLSLAGVPACLIPTLDGLPVIVESKVYRFVRVALVPKTGEENQFLNVLCV